MATALRVVARGAVASLTRVHRYPLPRVPCSNLRRCNTNQWRTFSDFGSFNDYDGYDEKDEATAKDEEKQRRSEEKRNELKQKKGRGWTDPWDLDEMLESNLDYDSLPDWAPNLVSRISQERVQIYSKNDSKIPLLQDLAALPLPPPPPPHPGLGQTKAYALYRKRAQSKYLLGRVTAMADPKIGSILKLTDWQDKQDAVDVLFEEIELTLRDKEEVLGKHPSFGLWVERALEEYLRNVQKSKNSSSETTATTAISETEQRRAADEAAVPIFMDCYNSAKDSEENAVPSVLIPLKPNTKGQSVGRMVEEWELSAHKTSKRIMLRQCTRQIASAVAIADESSPARIFVHGRQGVGKTAAISAVVASARTSGAIVLYLPEGDQMHKNGFYIEPNERRAGVFDLPVLQQGVCQNMVDTHNEDLALFEADAGTMEAFFTDDQLERFKGYEKGGRINLAALLSYGAEKVDFAPMCFSAAVDVLMKQEQKQFIMVLDEFNCFFQPGQYFHQDYDDEVKKPIPYHQVSLFQPILDAMAVTAVTAPHADLETPVAPAPVMMKRGAVIVGTTESHAVARKFTDALTANVKNAASLQLVADSTSGSGSGSTGDGVPLLHVIEVPRLSALEVEHMVANYEATGVGSLRLDRGETVMNDQEIAYLRMVSGGEAQKLMNACMM